MRKNFMLSLAAMAALPMAGLANTTWPVSLKPATDWTTEGTTTINPSSTPEDIFGVGTGISYTLTLPKGVYTLRRDLLNNATFTVTVKAMTDKEKDVVYSADKVLTLDLTKTTDVVLNLKAINPSLTFSVTGLNLTLTQDFVDDIQSNLYSRLYSLYEAIGYLPETATFEGVPGVLLDFKDLRENLWTKARALQDIIDKIGNVSMPNPDDYITEDYENGEENPAYKAERLKKLKEGKLVFDLYCEQELYNFQNFEDAPLHSQIEQAIWKLESVPYLYNTITGGAYASLKSTYEDLSDDFNPSVAGAYTQNIYKGIYADYMADMKSQVENLVENYNKGTLATYLAIKKTYETDIENLKESLAKYKATKQAFIDAETAWNAEKNSITTRKAQLTDAELGLESKEYYAKLCSSADTYLSTKYNAVTEALKAFNAINDKTALINFKDNTSYNAGFLTSKVNAVTGTCEKFLVAKALESDPDASYFDVFQPHVDAVNSVYRRIRLLKAANKKYQEINKDSEGKSLHLMGVTGEGDNAKDTFDDTLDQYEDMVNAIFANIKDAMKRTASGPELNAISVSYKCTVEVNKQNVEKDYGTKDGFAEAFKVSLDKLEPLLTGATTGNYLQFAQVYDLLDKKQQAVLQLLQDAETELETLEKTDATYGKYEAKAIWNKYAFEENNDDNPSLRESIKAINLAAITPAQTAITDSNPQEDEVDGVKLNEAMSTKYNALVGFGNDILVLGGPSNTPVSGFQVDAKKAYNDFTKVTKKLNEWTQAYKEKSAFITNPDVPYGLTTYGAALNELQSAIQTLETKLATAMGKEGNEHYNFIENAANQCDDTYSITTVDKNTYDTAKARYELPLAIDNANKQAAYVESLVATVKSGLADFYSDVDDYNSTSGDEAGVKSLLGESNSSDTQNYSGIEKAFYAIENVDASGDYITPSIGPTNPSTGKATTFEDVRLFMVALDADFVQVAQVSTALETLKEKLEARKVDFRERTRLYDYYMAVHNGNWYIDAESEWQKAIAYADQAKAIYDLNRDVQKATSMKESYDAIIAKDTEYNTNLINREGAWYTDLMGVDKTIAQAKQPIEAAMTTIENMIADFSNKMDASNDNYEYYNKNLAVVNASEKLYRPVLDEDGQPTGVTRPYAKEVAEMIMKDITAETAAEKRTAHEHFNAEAMAYANSDASDSKAKAYSLAGFQRTIKSKYEAGASKSYFEALPGEINKAIEEIYAVYTTCQNNDTNYENLTGYVAKNGVYGEKYNQIYNALEADGSSAVYTQWYAELDSINGLKDDVFSGRDLTEEEKGSLTESEKSYITVGATKHYTSGTLSDAVKNYYSQKLTNYFNDLTGVWRRYCNVEDGYYAQVLENNDKVHAEFLKKYEEVAKYYDSVIASLQNFVAKGFNKDDVQDAIDAIYEEDYKTQLEAQKTDEGQKYYELLQYNTDKDFIKLVKEGKAQAKSLPTSYKSDVETIYTGIYDAYHSATDKFNETSIENLKKVIGKLNTAVTEQVKLNEAGEAVATAGENGISAFYEEEVITASFKDLTDLLKKATNSYLTDGDLIFNYNGYADELKTAATDGIIAAKEALADNQIAAWQKVWKEENDSVQKYYKLYPTLLDGSFDGTNYLKNFNDARSAFDQAVAALDEAESKYAGMDKVNAKNVHPTYEAIEKLIKADNPKLSAEALAKFDKENKKDYDANLAKVKNAITAVENYFTAGIYVETSALDAVKAQRDEVVNLKASAEANYRFHLDATTIIDNLDKAVKAAGNLLAGAHQIDLDECEYLSKQVVYLKAYISDANNGVDASKYTEWLNKTAVALADYMAVIKKAGYVSNADSYDKLIGWQNDIAAKRAEITGFKAEEKKAELLKEIETYSEQYTTASENIGSLFEFQQKAIQKTYGTLTDQSADQTAAVNDAYDNKTLVFNADQLQIAIDQASGKMTLFQNAVNAAQEAKTTHENRCDELIQSLESTGYFGGKLAELQTLISTFDETVQKAFEDVLPYFEANAAKQAYDLAGLKVNPKDAGALLTASSEMKFVPTLNEFKPEESAASRVATATSTPTPFAIELKADIDDFYKFFSTVEEQCSKEEAGIRAANFNTKVLAVINDGINGLELANIIKDRANIINEKELDLSIRAEYAAIETAYENLKGYIEAAASASGILTKDIDGKDLVDEKGQPTQVKVDFVADCRQAIFDKIVELSARVEQVIANTDANIYYLGDIDHDKAIDVNDFVTLRLHLLGYAEHQLEGLKLRAADTNNDGQLNIGDLTKLVSMILGENTAAAPARVAKNIVTNDALAVVAEGEGVHQRIGIMLDAQQVYAGCQMDILLPEGVTLISESLGEMADGLSLSSNDLENGNHRVILSSVDGTAMTTGNGAMLWLDVEVGHNYNGEGIELSNILFSNAAGRTFELSVASGETTGLSNVSMTQEVKEKIYNVGGILMDSLKRGVNIIRGNDGSSKKIVK